MSTPLSQPTLVEDTLAHLPMLVRQVHDGINAALNSGPQHRALLDPWMRQRLRFEERLVQALTPMLQAGANGEDPLARPPGTRKLGELSLVDEQQALQDVALAHVIQIIEDHSRTELHQLGNFFAALRGIARPRKDDNPLRADVFAQGLQLALGWVPLDSQGQYQLMRAAAHPMASALGQLYEELCQRLRDANLAAMVGANRVPPSERDEHRLRRANEVYLDPTLALDGGGATLEGLARRVDEQNAPAQGLGADAAPAASSIASGGDLLTRLYERILDDARLMPPVKARVGRLQGALTRLAAADPALLRSPEHPAWRLLNRISTHGAAFERPQEARLLDFLRFLDEHCEPLAQHPRPTAALFQALLEQVDDFIGNQARRGGEISSAALASLEREQMRSAWQAMVREQIQAQMDDAPEALTSPPLRVFLREEWAAIIADAMVRHGHEAPEAQAAIALVDDLLESLRPPADAQARKALYARLPALVRRLEESLDGVRLDPERRRQVLDELMRLHGRLLLGPAAPAPAPAPTLDPESRLRQLVEERGTEHQASRWAHEDVDRSRLATVPVALYTQEGGDDSRQALRHWVDSQLIGAWYHLFVQSHWVTAQLAWVSESRHYFLFVGQDADERHSLTRGALERLLSHGLITSLENDGVVQRAISTLMQDLSPPPVPPPSAPSS